MENVNNEVKIYSKVISKVDDEAKQLIIDFLDNKPTCGFDLDSVYYIKNRGYVVIEFLKCDTVDPYKSHPNRYWFNKQKFISLWNITKKLEGQLYLLNYSKHEQWKNNFRIMEVLSLDESKGIETLDIVLGNFESAKKWFSNLNKNACLQ